MLALGLRITKLQKHFNNIGDKLLARFSINNAHHLSRYESACSSVYILTKRHACFVELWFSVSWLQNMHFLNFSKIFSKLPKLELCASTLEWTFSSRPHQVETALTWTRLEVLLPTGISWQLHKPSKLRLDCEFRSRPSTPPVTRRTRISARCGVCSPISHRWERHRPRQDRACYRHDAGASSCDDASANARSTCFFIRFVIFLQLLISAFGLWMIPSFEHWRSVLEYHACCLMISRRGYTQEWWKPRGDTSFGRFPATLVSETIQCLPFLTGVRGKQGTAKVFVFGR